MQCLYSNKLLYGHQLVWSALVHGVQALWTADRDFSRFPRLRTVNPLI